MQVRLTLNPDGSVVLDAPTAETGTGSSSCTVFACADALAFLGVGAADITYLAHTDTDRGLKDMVQTDSAVSYLQAELMPKAAEELKRKLVAHLARLLEAPEDEVDVRAGRVFWGGGPDDGRPLADILLAQSDLGSIVVEVEDLPPAQVTGCPFTACFAEVEVDTETGAVEVVQRRAGDRLRQGHVPGRRRRTAHRRPDHGGQRGAARADRLRRADRPAPQLQLGRLPHGDAGGRAAGRAGGARGVAGRRQPPGERPR